MDWENFPSVAKSAVLGWAQATRNAKLILKGEEVRAKQPRAHSLSSPLGTWLITQAPEACARWWLLSFRKLGAVKGKSCRTKSRGTSILSTPGTGKLRRP